MQDIIKADLQDSIDTKKEVLKSLVPQIEAAAKMMIKTIKSGKKVIFCGNGGSAADSQHLAAELVGRFKKNRPALASLSLTTDTSIITAVGNDFGFDTIFARQVEALGQKEDVLVGISTSGNSKDVVEAVKKAKTIGIGTIGLLGCGGGELAKLVDLSISIPGNNTPRIQESHITIGHIICGLIEKELFPK